MTLNSKKCDECEYNCDTTSCNEFNKNLCDDCYTEYRYTILNMFGLKDLYDVNNLLERIR